MDEFKVSGGQKVAEEAWRLIGSPSKMTPAILIDKAEPCSRYLGCEHKLYERDVDWQNDELPTPERLAEKASGSGISAATRKRVRCMEYDMYHFVKSCVDSYCKFGNIKRNAAVCGDSLPGGQWR